MAPIMIAKPGWERSKDSLMITPGHPSLEYIGLDSEDSQRRHLEAQSASALILQENRGDCHFTGCLGQLRGSKAKNYQGFLSQELTKSVVSIRPDVQVP